MPENVYDDGCLRVEHDNYYVTCNGEYVRLTRVEFLIFSRLVRSPERVVESTKLWRHVWGDSKPLNRTSLKAQVCRLRRLFEPYGLRIESMINVGYSISLRAGGSGGRSAKEKRARLRSASEIGVSSGPSTETGRSWRVKKVGGRVWRAAHLDQPLAITLHLRVT